MRNSTRSHYRRKHFKPKWPTFSSKREATLTGVAAETAVTESCIAARQAAFQQGLEYQATQRVFQMEKDAQLQIGILQRQFQEEQATQLFLNNNRLSTT